MVDVLFWIVFGALVGWVAGILHGHSASTRALAYITIGAIGGLCGGVSGLLLSSEAAEYFAPIGGLTFAIFGALVFVVVARYAYRQQSEQ